MKRYTLRPECTVLPTNGEMVVHVEGEYVLYDAAKLRIAALEADAARDKERIAALEDALEKQCDTCYEGQTYKQLEAKLSRYEALVRATRELMDNDKAPNGHPPCQCLYCFDVREALAAIGDQP